MIFFEDVSWNGNHTATTTPNAIQPKPILPSSTIERPQRALSQSASSKMKKKASRSRSKVWDHFTKFVNKQGDIKAKYNYCPKDFYADLKRNGITTIKSHMPICRSRLNACDDPSQSEIVIESRGDGSLGTWKFNQDVIRKEIDEMIILDELPFKFVDGRRFRQCMS